MCLRICIETKSRQLHFRGRSTIHKIGEFYLSDHGRQPRFGQNAIIAELRRPEGPPSGASYPYRELKETHVLIFSCYRGQRYFSWARTHDDGGDGGVAQHGGHTPNNRLIETCSLGLPCTFLIYDIAL